jgi:hypothetical protein
MKIDPLLLLTIGGFFLSVGTVFAAWWEDHRKRLENDGSPSGHIRWPRRKIRTFPHPKG